MKIKKALFFRINDDAPPDMLRYDLAFVSKDDPRLIVLPTFKTKDGNLGGRVTHGRWRSFHVGLEPFADNFEEACMSERLPAEGEQWITYRHPTNENGSRNYSELAPVTLQDFLDAKDSRDL